MTRIGIPIIAIKNSMIIDGYDQLIINNLPDDKNLFIINEILLYYLNL